MEILQLRVVLDHDQQVFRDIEMVPGGTMDEIHEAILVAFQLDNDQMASFYESDEQWNKGAEIGLMDMGTSEEPIAIMSQTGTARNLPPLPPPPRNPHHSFLLSLHVSSFSYAHVSW